MNDICIHIMLFYPVQWKTLGKEGLVKGEMGLRGTEKKGGGVGEGGGGRERGLQVDIEGLRVHISPMLLYQIYSNYLNH